MSSQNSRYSKGLFRTMPEQGAQVADLAETLIPGGRGFVQQLFRAKKDFLQGVSHLIDAQIHELEGIDSAISDESRRPPPPPPPPQGMGMGMGMGMKMPRPSMPGMSMGEVLKKAGEMLFWKPKRSHGYGYGQRTSASPRQYMPGATGPTPPAPTVGTGTQSTSTTSTTSAAPGSGSSAGTPPGPEAPEKIKIT
jgi:hypothetical protein